MYHTLCRSVLIMITALVCSLLTTKLQHAGLILKLKPLRAHFNPNTNGPTDVNELFFAFVTWVFFFNFHDDRLHGVDGLTPYHIVDRDRCQLKQTRNNEISL